MIRIANLLAIALLAGCNTMPATGQPDAGSVADGSELQLGIGETARLADGSRLTYLRLVNDSRCPPKVQCVWAGDAEIDLRWQPASGSARDISLHTSANPGPTNARIGDRSITLIALARGIAPKAMLKVERTP